MCCKWLAENTGRKKSPFRHHRTTLSGCTCIFATKACIDNRKKNLLNSNTCSSTCPHNKVNFGPLTAEICCRVWGAQQISTGFASWQRYCTALYSSGRQPNFAALNRGRHLYSAGRPPRWALAHILVVSALTLNTLNYNIIVKAMRLCSCASGHYTLLAYYEHVYLPENWPRY